MATGTKELCTLKALDSDVGSVCGHVTYRLEEVVGGWSEWIQLDWRSGVVSLSDSAVDYLSNNTANHVCFAIVLNNY